MDEYSNHDLDSSRGLSAFNSAIAMGTIELKEAADLLRGHPCEDEFLARFPELKNCAEPPYGASPSD